MSAPWHTYKIAGGVSNCHSKAHPTVTEITFYGDQVLVYCDPNSNNDFPDFIRQLQPHTAFLRTRVWLLPQSTNSFVRVCMIPELCCSNTDFLVN